VRNVVLRQFVDLPINTRFIVLEPGDCSEPNFKTAGKVFKKTGENWAVKIFPRGDGGHMVMDRYTLVVEFKDQRGGLDVSV